MEVGLGDIFNLGDYSDKFEPTKCNKLQCDAESVLSACSDDKDIYYYNIFYKW